MEEGKIGSELAVPNAKPFPQYKIEVEKILDEVINRRFSREGGVSKDGSKWRDYDPREA